jgi:hypothetical protein
VPTGIPRILGCVFARYFVEIPMPAEDVLAAIVGAPDRLAGLATGAAEHGEGLLAEVGFGSVVRVHRRVSIEVHEPISLATTTVLPLRWEVEGVAPGLFPSMDADLEIAPLGPVTTQVAISARYTPPLGTLGRAIDRAVLHRVAEATLKDFMDRLRAALLDPARA